MARPAAVFSLVMLAVTRTWPARADEPSPRPVVLALELGLMDSPRHLTRGGVVRFAPPEYAAVVLDGRASPHVHIDGQVGLGFVTGWMASVSARLAAEVQRLTISLGAGPLVASGSWSGPPAPFANTDFSATFHLDGSFVLLFRAGAAWALGDRGRPACGIDTCDPFLARGDRIIFTRLGLGRSF